MNFLLNSIISAKYFTVSWPGSGPRIWVFLCNVDTREPFEETKIWDRDCLRNIQNFKISMKYFIVAWSDSGTHVSVFLYNVNTQESL